jgi:hypothetical protein
MSSKHLITWFRIGVMLLVGLSFMTIVKLASPFFPDNDRTLADLVHRRQKLEDRWAAPVPTLPPSARNRTRKFSKLLFYNREQLTALAGFY